MYAKSSESPNKGGNKTIVWFRRDLRMEDNPALTAAARDGFVYPVYIWCPKEEGQFCPGRVSRWWLKQSLVHLKQSLKSLGTDLVLMKTQSTIFSLLECINATGATKVAFNCLYDPISLVRDHNIKEKLVELGISVQSYNADLLYEPWDVYDENGNAYTTFKDYWDKCLLLQKDFFSTPPPWKLQQAAACNCEGDYCETTSTVHGIVGKGLSLVLILAGTVDSCSIEELGLEDKSEKSSNALLARAWSPGWSNADKALSEFLDRHLLEYAKNRQQLGASSTSLLSPYLHFGEVSVCKVFQQVRMKQILWAREGNSVGEQSSNMFLRAIGLREYSRYMCFNFPFTHERSFLSSLKFFPWHASQDNFKAWRQGKTGYPLVDAGMRELWATGWIHNRIRVIVSSFAVKVLLLPWKWGVKYFWDTLLDADLESDVLGWQYISGSLPDGHELERLDDPQIQGSKFDPDGEYIRHWLPELARMPTEWIHHPWDAPQTVLQASGVELGLNYPKPIVELDFAVDQLTEAIVKMREIEATTGENSNGTNEVVMDNAEKVQCLGTTNVITQAKTCATYSSNDQKVPTIQNSKVNNSPLSRKRSKAMEEKGEYQYNIRNNVQSRAGTSNEDLCSTAESSSSKKPTTSRTSFSVPQFCSLSKGIPQSSEENTDRGEFSVDDKTTE